MATEMQRPQWWSSTARFIVVTAGIVIIIAGLQAAASIIAPLLLAIFFALLIYPILRWLGAKGLPGWLSSLLLFVGVLIAGAAVIIFASISLSQLDEKIPVYQQNLTTLTDSIKASLAARGVDVSNVSASSLFDPQALARAAAGFFAILFNQLSGAILALLLLIFLLAEAPTFPEKAKRALGSENPVVRNLATFGQTVLTYMRVRTISNLFVGVVFTILLLALGVDFAVLWGFLAFILSYIPTIGLVLAAIPAVLVALLEQGINTAVIVTIGVIIINSISDNVIAPRLSAKELELSPFIVFFSFVFWAWVLGPVGGLLSVILTVAVKSILEGFNEARGLAMIMGPTLPPEEKAEKPKQAA